MTRSEKTPQSAAKSMKVYGIITIILGILAMMAPVLTGLSVAMILGILVLLAGITRMIWAFQAGTLGRGLLMFAVGGLTLLCGIALLANPLLAAGVLTILLSIYLLVDGVSEVIVGFQLKPANGWGLLVFGGVISIVLGAMIWAQYPLSGPWAMGILIGIKLVFVGLIMIAGGSVVRTLKDT